jgi:thiosulfate dehydrogenase (quinone) large subunit
MSTIAQTQIPEPPISRFVFADTRFAWVWFIMRLYVGWEWVVTGWEKIQSPSWVGPDAGKALTGFIMGALKKTGGAHPDVFGWYAQFLHDFVLPNVSFFSHLVAYGELFVGLGLIFGLFTGIAAFFGAFMNMNYLFAGTLSTNPLLFLLELLLILAWRVAGFLGLDRIVLPLLGTPWFPGKIFKKR